MQPGESIWVRAKWGRPTYCRDDWAKVRLPNGYGYFSPIDVIEIIDENNCWVRATFGRANDATRMAQIRFTDYSGEGSLDSVSESLVRPREVSE